MGKKGTAPLEGHVSGQANKPLSLPAHSLTLAQVVDELSTETWSGLDDDEAKRRIDEYGANELDEAEGVSVVKILVAQVANAMTLVLILAMAVSYGIKSWIEGGVVTAVIVLNIGASNRFLLVKKSALLICAQKSWDSSKNGLRRKQWILSAR
jgi:Na+-exporting ATPase